MPEAESPAGVGLEKRDTRGTFEGLIHLTDLRSIDGRNTREKGSSAYQKIGKNGRGQNLTILQRIIYHMSFQRLDRGP